MGKLKKRSHEKDDLEKVLKKIKKLNEKVEKLCEKRDQERNEDAENIEPNAGTSQEVNLDGKELADESHSPVEEKETEEENQQNDNIEVEDEEWKNIVSK